MTVRLNVILVQSPGMSGLQSEINAELAIQLMGVAGIDVAVVNALSPATATATDRLLLTATQNDIAIVDWRAPSELLRDLAQLGVAGARAPHRLDPDAAPVSAGSRRLYLIDLRRGDRPARVVEALHALLQERRVVTVALAAPAASPRPRTSPASIAPASLAAGAAQAPSVQNDSASTALQTDLPPNRSADSSQPLQPRPTPSPTRWPSESDLEALVDGVNGNDW